jgi:hypothetical protein
MMILATDFRRQAQVCARLAEDCDDRRLAERFKKMATDLLAKADDFEEVPSERAWQRYRPAQRTASDCSCASISAYLDTLVSSPFGTICSSISAVPFDGGYVTVVVPA